MRFDDISFVYGADGGDTHALRSITLELSPGQHFAVLGANGSGKSTLVRLANGMLLPRSGQVTVDGIDTRDANQAIPLRQRVGMVFQRPDDQIVATTVEDDIAFGPENLGLPRADIRTRVDEALDAVGMSGLESREPHTLSGGQKQRLAIAGALAMRPAYLVLDEPTSMLDARGREDVLGILRRLVAAGTGVLQVTHDLADVSRADRAIVLDRGALVFEGRIVDLVARAERLAQWGLELPTISRLSARLREFGVPVPEGMPEVEALAVALWG